MTGRKKEIDELTFLCEKDASALVAIYGRRRIGKTYLVNALFSQNSENCLFFSFTGTSDARAEIQIKNFIEQVYEWFRAEPSFEIKTWSDAFRFLKRTIDDEVKKMGTSKKIVIFIDELPWIDPLEKAGFLAALGYFWNTYCEPKQNILMILCGSNASWIKNKVLEDAKGPLHNRITKKLAMYPFDLSETKEYLIKEKGFDIGEKLATDIYMIFGGVAKYLSYLNPKKTLSNNIDELFFSLGGLMYGEYEKVFNSLFMSKVSSHKKIIDFLCKQRSGYTLTKTASALSLTGAATKKYMEELEECGFVRGITKFGMTKREIKYIVADPYIYFYHKWIKSLSMNDILQISPGYWNKQTQTQSYSIWRGFSFESVMLQNMPLFLNAKGMSGIAATYGYWNTLAKKEGETGAQIDIVVDYGNNLYDIVECKYYSEPFEITKKYAQELKNKLYMFREYGVKRKSSVELNLVFVTSEGVKTNDAFHSLNIENIFLSDMVK